MDEVVDLMVETLCATRPTISVAGDEYPVSFVKNRLLKLNSMHIDKASRYTKKYMAEHETDIILHRAAQKAFNELNLAKLPTVKSLQSEYST